MARYEIPDDMITRKEAAEQLGMAENSVAGVAQNYPDSLPEYKFGSRAYYRKDDVERFRLAREQSACAAPKLLHTPGPWEAACDREEIDNANAILARIGGKIVVIAEVCDSPEILECQSGADAMDQVDANARLMAAATELLTALTNLAHYCYGPSYHEGIVPLLSAANRAIDKATGETHSVLTGGGCRRWDGCDRGSPNLGSREAG